jgi:hypothetical protein
MRFLKVDERRLVNLDLVDSIKYTAGGSERGPSTLTFFLAQGACWAYDGDSARIDVVGHEADRMWAFLHRLPERLPNIIVPNYDRYEEFPP